MNMNILMNIEYRDL